MAAGNGEGVIPCGHHGSVDQGVNPGKRGSKSVYIEGEGEKRER